MRLKLETEIKYTRNKSDTFLLTHVKIRSYKLINYKSIHYNTE